MARIDLDRRAEIGRERRERTRRSLLTAAKRVFSESPIEQVDVDDIVRSAGVAKGTFYLHFRDFDAIVTAIGDELAIEFDELLQEQRSRLTDPLDRLGWGLCGFMRRAAGDPRWGRLVRHARFTENSAASVRNHLASDVDDARRSGSLMLFSTPFAVRLVLAMAMEFFDADDTLRPAAAADMMVEAIFRALGVDAKRAQSIVRAVTMTPPDPPNA